MRRTKWLVGMCLTAVVAAGASCGPARAADTPDRKAQEQEIRKLYQETGPFRELFVKTAEYITPAVVSISVTKSVTVQEMPGFEMPFPWGNPFERMPRQQQPQQREIPEHGLGSGFVIDAEKGWIITNAHVVKDVKAEDVEVVFADGRTVKAKEVFADTRTDVAVIRVEPDHMVALQWAETEVRPGDYVMAMGSPMGFGSTITTGILSAPSTKSRVFGGGRRGSLRVNEDPYAIEDYIQTDAAINPGNSGGPLVTLDGKVIGINTLIVSSSMASAGLGFAVPARIARPVVEQLIARGKIVRGHLGVAIVDPADVDDQSAQQLFKMKTAKEVFDKFGVKADDEGVIVADVMPNGPAAKAGLRRGDLIKSMAGKEITDVDYLRDLTASMSPGTQVNVEVLRNGEKKQIEVVIGEQPEGSTGWAQAPGEGITSDALGMSAQTLTPEIAEALGYGPDLRGVIVTDVAPDGPAAQSGLQRNDIILQVGRNEIQSAEELMAAVDNIPPQGIAFLIRRGDATRFVHVKP